MGDEGDVGMTSITVAGVTFNNSGAVDADGVVWMFSETKGWFDGPPTKSAKTDRPQSHGTFAERIWRDGRLIVVTGHVKAPTRRLASNAQMTLTALLAEGTFDSFAVDDPDQGVMASEVRLEGQQLVDWDGQCDIDAQLTFYAPDPLRYGTVVSVSTGFPSAGGGLQYPLYTNRTIRPGVLSFGARSTSGRLLIANPGNGAMWPQWQVAGQVPAQGFEIVRVGTGERLRFEGGVSAGSTLVMDSATGVVLVDGYADRSGLLTWRDWSSVAPGTSAEFAFTNLGSFSAAQLTASCTPGWW
jgi:hypothetical protein